MALTTPNQILHYTASAANYPGWAIRVGNFAFSDVGNNVSGSWGTFRLGLNPKAFTTDITPGHINTQGFSTNRGFTDGEELQTYVVYIHKPDLPLCKGPSCFLLDNVKIVPNTDESYPGGIGPNNINPWYHLVKFTQFMGASTSLIGTYSSTLDYDTSNPESMVFLENTIRWYREQLVLGDGNLYAGGTAGNRVLINKFYPPIITTSATRIFDTSYLPSFPYSSGNDSQIPPGRKVYNLVGLTHGVVRSGENFKLWDFEGGAAGAIGGGGFMDIPGDPGFRLCGSDEPADWCLNMYVMSPTASGSYDQANFIKQGISSTNQDTNVTFGMGIREPVSGSGNFQLYMNLWLSSGRNDYVLHGATMSLFRWYFISVKRIKGNNYTFYFNGKQVHLQSESTIQGSFTGANAGATAAVGIWAGGAAIRFQYLSYYPINQSSDDIRENFLRYALNSKIKNSNIRIALDTGTKTSHQGSQQWIDISGYDYHATSPAGDNFAWGGYKPGYTTKRGDILRSGRTDLDYFASSPFCLSIWFYIVDKTQNFNIFSKDLDNYFTIRHVATNTIQVSTEGNGSGQYTGTIGGIVEEKWHNIFVTGTKLDDVKFYIFTHTGENEDVQSQTLTVSGGGITNPTVNNTSDIRFGDTGNYCRIASIIYWNTNFSEALCKEFFSIQKGRFGMDSYSNRIAGVDQYGCDPI